MRAASLGSLEAAGLSILQPGVALPTIVASGLIVTVGSFKLKEFVFIGGTINAVASKTQYLCVNLRTSLLHMLPRLYDEGVVYLANIVTSATAVTAMDKFVPNLPETKVPRALMRFQRGEAIKINLFGSSLMQGALWTTYNFAAASYSTGYNVGGLATDYVANGSFASGDTANWTGGTPTGTSIVTGVGPEGQNALQWSGGGRLWQEQLAVGAVQYTVTVYARLISGNPTVTAYIKDRATDNVRGSTSLALTSSWQPITVTAATAGASAGFRIEFPISSGSGTVQLTKITAFAYTTTVTTTDYAMGGASALYTLALLGTAVQTFTGNYHETNGVVEGFRPFQWVKSSTPQARISGPSAGFSCDLAIVALLANGGIDQLSVYEGAVRILRARGIEVLLLTDNAMANAGNAVAQDADGLWNNGTYVKAFAEKYGCALADTAAYMREGEWRGEAVYADTIHQSVAGQAKWAEAVAGVLGHAVTMPSGARVFDPSTYVLTSTSPIPGRVDVDFSPNTTGNPTAVTGLGSGSNPHSAAYGGLSTVRTDFVTGQSVYLCHPMFINADLIIDASSDFTATIKYNAGSSTLTTMTYLNGGAGVRPNVIGVASYATVQTQGALGVGFGSAAFEVVITSGTMRLYGIAYHCPDYVDVTDDMHFFGTWLNEAGPYGYAMLNYTDTANDFAFIEYLGKTLIVFYSRKTAGGIVQEYNNGVLPAVNDLYTAGTYYGRYAFSARAYGRNQFITKYTGTNNASAIATVAANRRLAISQVFAVRDR